jgi:SHS2 domain-containing protein
MPFRYLDDVTAADAAFEAWGESLGQLCAAAWEATVRVMVNLPGDPEGWHPQEALVHRVRRGIRLEAAEPDLLLHDLLEELVYLKDTKGLLLLLSSCRVEQREGRWRLDAVAVGEEIDPERHRLGVDVKAITWHRFEVRQADGNWRATVVLDV